MSIRVSISRSPLRLLAYAALAVPAILLAVDMLFWSYRFAPEPDTYDVVVGSTVNELGQPVDVVQQRLTADGEAQRRRDLFFGVSLMIGGAAAMGWGLKELVSPTVLLRADDDGIAVRLDGPNNPSRLFPWEEVVEVRSGVVDSEGASISALSIRLRDPEMIPADPAGAQPEPPWIHVFADEWDRPAHLVAPLLDQRAERPHPDGGDE